MKNIEPYKVNCPQCRSNKTSITDRNIRDGKKYLKAILSQLLSSLLRELFKYRSPDYYEKFLGEDLFINCSNCGYEDKFVPNKEYIKHKRAEQREKYKKYLPAMWIVVLVSIAILIYILYYIFSTL